MALYRESFVFRIETDEPAMFWTGIGDLLLPDDAILDGPEIALGGGELVTLPDVEQLINGVAQRIEVVLSGVSEETIVYAQEEAPQVPGAAVYIGRVRFDENWQLVGGVEWEWTGEARALAVSGDDGDDGRTRSLTLKIASGDTIRSRAAYAFFTDTDQKANFPTDEVFSNVGKISAGTSRRWGPKSD